MLITSFNTKTLTTYEKVSFYETICNNPYIRFKPYPKQSWSIFLANRPATRDENGKLRHNRVLAGAGGFGGKTYMGSMLAAQYLTEEDYSCLVTRKNYTELIGIDSIFQNLVDWTCDVQRLGDLACKKVESKLIKITSPYGAEIHFKAFDREGKKQKIKGESYDRIINDESSELDQAILTFQNRSLRQDINSKIPLSVINLSNPGGPSTQYLLEKFVDGYYPYVALDWRDNPYIDKEAYEASLDELDPIDKQYQKYGNWHYKPSKGDLFDRETLKNSVIDEYKPGKVLYNILSIDLASTGSDMTAISCISYMNNRKKVILDLNEEKSKHPETMIYNFIEKWNPFDTDLMSDELIIEQEPGSDYEYSRRYWVKELEDFVDRGLKIELVKPEKSKYQRARPLSRYINNGNAYFYNKIDTKILEKTFDELITLDPEGKGKSPNLVDSITLGNFYLDKRFNKKKSQIIVI